jgi:hypothetical protein
VAIRRFVTTVVRNKISKGGVVAFKQELEYLEVLSILEFNLANQRLVRTGLWHQSRISGRAR